MYFKNAYRLRLPHGTLHGVSGYIQKLQRKGYLYPWVFTNYDSGKHLHCGTETKSV